MLTLTNFADFEANLSNESSSSQQFPTTTSYWNQFCENGEVSFRRLPRDKRYSSQTNIQTNNKVTSSARCSQNHGMLPCKRNVLHHNILQKLHLRRRIQPVPSTINHQDKQLLVYVSIIGNAVRVDEGAAQLLEFDSFHVLHFHLYRLLVHALRFVSSLRIVGPVRFCVLWYPCTSYEIGRLRTDRSCDRGEPGSDMSRMDQERESVQYRQTS